MIKNCNKCNNPKEYQSFYFNKKTNKYFNTCIECCRLMDKLRYQRNKLKLEGKEVTPNKCDKAKDRLYRILNFKMQICSTCKIDKPISDFYKKGVAASGYSTTCKHCSFLFGKKWMQNNKEKERIRKTNWRKSPAGQLYMKQYTKQRESKDVQFKLRRRMGRAIYGAIKQNHYLDSKTWIDIFGYTVNDLKCHLESRFLPGMTWDNYGVEGWHIDHIIPQSWFEYKSPTDPSFKACWALSNLQPKWAIENLKKGNRYIG